MMPRTDSATSSSVSRLAEISAAKCAANSGALASSLRAILRLDRMRWFAERGPFAADVGQLGVDIFHVQPDGAAARENHHDHAARIFVALGQILDRQQ